MDELFAKYEHELGNLRSLCREYAQRYPKVAARLQMGGDTCDDPHVERLIQAVALLCARVTKRLDDSYPQFTEALLNLLFPHYLRPFPSCAIARFGDTSTFTQIARGTLLESESIGGVACTFTTAYALAPTPVVLTRASYTPIIDAPAATRLPPDATSCITLAFDAPTGNLASAPMMRFYIDADPSFCALLRDVLFLRTSGAWLQTGEDEPWQRVATLPIRPVGFADDEALLPSDARVHAASRLLAEYFAFPEKFNFVDVDLPALVAQLPAATAHLTLHLPVAGIRADADQARMLSNLSTSNLLQGCTPVVNLFRQPGVPIKFHQRSPDYTVLAHGSHPQAFDIYSIDQVHLVQQLGKGAVASGFKPFYSLRHGEENGADQGRYWLMRHDETLAICSPGHEKAIALVDASACPLPIDDGVLSIELTCTNRDLPCAIRIGAPEGDLFLRGAPGSNTVRLLRRPTRPARLMNTPDTQWRLISHLALNHQSLLQNGAHNLREMLTLYDLAQTPVSRRQIGGIVAMAAQETTAWMRHKRGTSLVHGMEIRLTLDETAYTGAGLHLFAQVLDECLGRYVHLNSFVELVVLSQHSGKELFRCQPRSGSTHLV
ncbi:MAG: type VI secretion system baseplate subunit TssF [Pseudomonadota bacterium]|nr:type VI secretion system baseplate subunit TssF [Pseudomonadota bacterium]